MRFLNQKTLFSFLSIATALVFAASASGATKPSASILLAEPNQLSNTANQARVVFSEKMINLSTPNQNANIFDVVCSPQVNGRPRWNDDKTWTFNFDTPLDGNFLPGGTRCQFSLKAGIKSLAGQTITGKTSFSFQIDGPNVIAMTPSHWGTEVPTINEDQIFLLKLDTAIDLDSLVKNTYLAVEGRGSAVPIKIVDDAVIRDQIKRQYGEPNALTPVIAIQARELLPTEKKAVLVLAPGITAKGGMARQSKASYEFLVRPELKASFTCVRENAKANCSPLLPLTLEFNAPIGTEFARKIVLISADGARIAAKIDGQQKTVSSVQFNGPFKESANYRIELPSGIKDDADRSLSNKSMFPLQVKTAAFPPLAKFSAQFGVIEAKPAPALLPVTLRNLEAQVLGQLNGVSVGGNSVRLNASNFPEVIKWLQKLSDRNEYEDRGTSVFDKQKGLNKFNLPLQKNGRSFEVMGIPLPGPGFYVVEMQSKILGQSLLGQAKTMYVPTSALVTNLAVHLKWGLSSSLFWVTALDTGAPVAGAMVKLHACDGSIKWSGTSDQNGVAKFDGDIKKSLDMAACQRDGHYGMYNSGFYVTAEAGGDFTFTYSGWTQGIESERFGNLPTLNPYYGSEEIYAHTVLARNLLRAGEAVNMKTFVRRATTSGLGALKANDLPTQMRIEHMGSDSRITLPLNWNNSSTSVETNYTLAKEAKLGVYEIILVKNPGQANEKNWYAGSFRVEEFKIPLLKASISLPKKELVQPGTLQPQLTIAYQNGGPASNMNVLFRYQVSDSFWNNVSDYEEFRFLTPKVKEGIVRYGENSVEDTDKVVSQKIRLSEAGAGQAKIEGLSGLAAPKNLQMELEFQDANGESQTVSRTATVYPSERVVGLKADRWIGINKDIEVQAVVLDLNKKPIAGATVDIMAYKVESYSHRKRLVGGFYAYENASETSRIPARVNCQGVTDKRGLIFCKVSVDRTSGEVLLMAETSDKAGNSSFAQQSVWIRGSEDVWFDVEDTDRIDLIPEKRRYEPGETARLQVRMPFRNATALITLEREGVIDSRVVQLSGSNPTIEVPIKKELAPNIFVSAFLVRGRVTSEEGAKPKPGDEFIVDLNKPAFKMGVAQLGIGWKHNQLKVSVQPNKEIYQPREEASALVKVVDSEGQPAHGEIAFAVVDEGLLQLQANNSWNLLEAMMARRPWAVQTATAQMQVIGKRHFGLKAVAHGGDGGSQLTRELFDTLLSWQGQVKLNEKGEALVKFKINDSLTRFRVVAIADSGLSQFGKGEASITSSQDLIANAGQSSIARHGDQMSADLMIRNTTKGLQVATVSGSVTFTNSKGENTVQSFSAQKIKINGGEALNLNMGQVKVPDGAILATYTYQVDSETAHDRLTVKQEIKPLVVARTQMAQLEQINDRPVTVGVEFPKNAKEGLGGVKVSLMDSLARGLDSIADYFNYTPWLMSVEAKISRAVALNDSRLWAETNKLIATQIDDQGLLKWYPGAGRGSIDMTLYALAVSKEAGLSISEEPLQKMIQAMTQLAEGRMRKEQLGNMSQFELNIRRISAMAALLRYQSGRAEWLKSVEVPNLAQLPTSSLIDLYRVLATLGKDAEGQKQTLATVAAIRSRLTLVGTRFEFELDKNSSWWQLSTKETNQARWIISILSDKNLMESWKSEVSRLQMSLFNTRLHGYWDMSVTNAWAAIATRKFSAVIESGKIDGQTQVSLDQSQNDVTWKDGIKDANVQFAWPKNGRGEVTISHKGSGKPWAIVSTIAAVPTQTENFVGLQVAKTTQVVRQAKAGVLSRGDVVEVKLTVKAQAPISQVALFDPIPAGAKILGTGLAADDPRSTDWNWPDYDEKSYDGYRAVYGYLTTTPFEIIYRYQLNVVGEFQLPATRMEAVYTPETFAELANKSIVVKP